MRNPEPRFYRISFSEILLSLVLLKRLLSVFILFITILNSIYKISDLLNEITLR